MPSIAAMRAPTVGALSLGRPSAARVVLSRPAPLTTSFTNTASVASGLCASFSGLTLKVSAPSTTSPATFGLTIEANAKKSLGCTKGGTNQKRRRNSGFRARMQTPGGRKVLASRRAKGRKHLCKASDPKDGKSK